jgi:hypothetical protein
VSVSERGERTAAHHGGASTVDGAAQVVANWNPRKKRVFNRGTSRRHGANWRPTLGCLIPAATTS